MPALTKLYLGWSARFESGWQPPNDIFIPPPDLLAAWETDGIRLLGSQLNVDGAQAVAEVRADCSPAFVAQRLKGRWSYALRKQLTDPPRFERGFFLRTIGQNTRDVVQAYIRSQVDVSDLLDPLYRERMKELRFRQPACAAARNHHQAVYDCFLHVVFVTADRYRMREDEAQAAFAALRAAARGNEAGPWEISMMPDHTHLLLRWCANLSARGLFQNVQAGAGRILRRSALWSDSGYMGTVGPYRLNTALDMNRKAGWVRAKPEG